MIGLAFLALAIVRCGGDDICLNCEAVPTPTPGVRDEIRITGSIDQNGTNLVVDPSDITVIACFDLDPSLTDPLAFFNDCPARSDGNPDSDRNFTLTNNLSTIGQDQAAIRIGFWVPQQDILNPVTIKDGDFFAELTQEADQVTELEEVRISETAQMNPVDIEFVEYETGQQTTGVATTSLIRVFTTPTTTPTPAPTATP